MQPTILKHKNHPVEGVLEQVYGEQFGNLDVAIDIWHMICHMIQTGNTVDGRSPKQPPGIYKTL